MNSILYRCTGVIIDKEERHALHSAEVYADQSIPAVNIPLQPNPGEFFRGQNPHARGRKMAAKPRPPGQNSSCAKSPKAPPWGKSRRQVLAETVLITQLFDKRTF